jgi:hypothetical protein
VVRGQPRPGRGGAGCVWGRGGVGKRAPGGEAGGVAGSLDPSLIREAGRPRAPDPNLAAGAVRGRGGAVSWGCGAARRRGGAVRRLCRVMTPRGRSLRRCRCGATSAPRGLLRRPRCEEREDLAGGRLRLAMQSTGERMRTEAGAQGHIPPNSAPFEHSCRIHFAIGSPRWPGCRIPRLGRRLKRRQELLRLSSVVPAAADSIARAAH